MRILRYVAIIAVAGSAAACITRPGTLDTNLPPGAQWTATLTPENGSTLHGTVTFVRGTPATQTRAIFALAGAQANSVLPWHVHYGDCGSDHLIVGSAANYPPLVIGSTGSLTAAALLPLELSDGPKYVVHIHSSPVDMKTVACGPLVPDRAIASIATKSR